MFKQINLWYCIPPFLIFCVFVATLSLVHSQNTSSKKNPEEELAEIKANAEMLENVQMWPTAQRVLLLSTETLEESFRKLAAYDDGQYFEPGYETQRMGENTNMQILLSNRRVLKILQDFEKLPLDQAKTKAKELHKIALNSLSKVLDVEFEPYSSEKRYGVVRLNEQFMAMTSVLLSASLGDIPFVIQRIEEWELIITKVREKLSKKNYPPRLAENFSQHYFLDPTSFVSILMFATERKGTLPEILKNKVSKYRAVNIPLVAWNADKTYYDGLKYQGQGGGNFSLENTQMVFRVYNLPTGNEEYNRQNKELIQSLKEVMASMD